MVNYTLMLAGAGALYMEEPLNRRRWCKEHIIGPAVGIVPPMLAQCLYIGANAASRFIWFGVSPLLPDHVIKSISIVSTTVGKKKMLQKITANQLPVEFGGTLDDECVGPAHVAEYDSMMTDRPTATVLD